MTEEPKVAVVIVNWNRRELVLEAVNSFRDGNYDNTLIIVVDNASEDDSIQALKDKYPEILLIENSRNLGFARASNQGMERAFVEKADYVFFFNNDATVEKNCVRDLVAEIESDEETGAVAPFIFYYDRKDVIWYGGGMVALSMGWIGHKHLRKRYREGQFRTGETEYITGCAFMVRSNLLREIGGFDVNYGMYSEDVDLSLRIIRKRKKLKVVPNAKAYHRISASAGGALSPLKSFHRGRSNMMLIKRWIKPWQVPGMIICGIAGGLLVSLRLLVTESPGSVFALWSGIFSGLLGRKIPERYSVGESE